MSPVKVVKRYANRKLYDTERSCYVTLEDISMMIKAGDEVKVIDNKSGEDLTSVTLAQIIFETEKKNNFMPLSLLRNLIQSSGDAIGEMAREGMETMQVKAQEMRDTAFRLRADLEDRLEKVIPSETADAAVLLQDLANSVGKAFETLQKGVEERIKGSVGTVSTYANVGREMQEIREKLKDLETRINQLP